MIQEKQQQKTKTAMVSQQNKNDSGRLSSSFAYGSTSVVSYLQADIHFCRFQTPLGLSTHSEKNQENATFQIMSSKSLLIVSQS